MKRRNKVALTFNRDIPTIEWWDAPLLNALPYQQILQLTEPPSLEQMQKAVNEFRIDKVINCDEISG